jgi:predicted nucleotidyltransferase
MKFGLTEKEYQYIVNLFAPIKNKGAAIWCFGSRARGNHQPFSDLDLMIDAAADFAKEIGDLNEALIESNFPYKVDIVQKKDFAESYYSGFIKDRVLFF